jgi:2-oxoglutarate dehydrogenase E2 component (dihydrolipoamide succinyltransferase)
LLLLKIDVAVNAPASGTILEFFAEEEDTVTVGQDLVKIQLGDAPEGGAPKAAEPAKEEPKQPASSEKESPSKQETKEPVQEEQKQQPVPVPEPANAEKKETQAAPSSGALKGFGNREESRVCGTPP